MTVKSGLGAPPRTRPFKRVPVLQWLLDVLLLLAWGGVLLRYCFTGRITLLLHPDYVWLAYSAGFFLVGLSIIKFLQPFLHVARHQLDRWKQRGAKQTRRSSPSVSAMAQHASLLPPKWSSMLLLAVALFGLQFTPQPFASQVALDRGVTDSLTMTRSQPQAFRGNSSPEKRSLIDWIRTLNVYPEPDAYTGQKVNVDGFVIHSPNLSNQYLTLARFIITCCAADAYPVGIPVKLPTGDRTIYPPDTWLRIEGSMITETLDGKRQLVIQAKNLTKIPEPANPYSY
jgi:uncharacterized repeat protein (TIGR03943 family)